MELQVVDRLDYLAAIRVVFWDELPLPVSLPDGVQSGFFVHGHTLEYVVVFLGHLLDLIGTEDIAELDVAIVGVKLLLLGG